MGLVRHCSQKKQGYQVQLMDEGSLKDGYRNELKQSSIDFIEGRIDETELLNAEEVIKSPGIPEKNEWVKKLRMKGIIHCPKWDL